MTSAIPLDASTRALAPSDILYNAKTVREIFGISHVTLHRWQHGLHEHCRDKIIHPRAGFPAPIMIRGRRYWRKSDIVTFIAAREQASKAA